MTLPVAGWYADPADSTRLRWWDGSAWTESTREAPGAAAASAASVVVSGAPPAQPSAGSGSGWSVSAEEPSVPPAEQPSVPPVGQSSLPPVAAGPSEPDAGMPYGGAPSARGSAAPGNPPVATYPSVPTYPSAPTYPAAGAYPPFPGQPAYGGYPGVPAKAATTPDGVRLANLGSRLGARIIDWLVLSILTALPAIPLWLSIVPRVMDYLDRARQAADNGEALNPFSIYTDTGILPFLVEVTVISMAISAAYTVMLIHLRGATLGKLAVGVRVRPWAAEGLPTWGQAWKRWLTAELAGAFVGLYLLIDYLWPLWDDRKQALHDKWPGTVVVAARS